MAGPGGGTGRLPGDLTAEGMLLQVEETGSALNVGQGSGRVIFCHSKIWRTDFTD